MLRQTTYNCGHNILRIFDILPNLPQVKLVMIISNENGIYELRHELLNKLILYGSFEIRVFQ